MLKFPYSVCDFYKLITNNYYYADRTNHIRLIEEAGEQLLFLRPRRFGKTLLLSMLENYYDVAKADEFERLFGHLAIGQNPTPKHNQYLVMTWDFSVVSSHGEIERVHQALHEHLNNAISNFATRYQDLLQNDISINSHNAISSFESALTAIGQTPYRLYLLIDEYDNFANEMMMGSQELSKNRYDTLLSGEGLLKTVFKTVKSASAGRGLDRVFISGISPVVLSDITSGYNVAENIYSKFNDLCGFHQDEIESVLRQILAECQLPETRLEGALSLMRNFYDGYCFVPRLSNFVYNPTLALYFLKSFQETCQHPQTMLDDNLAMDKEKITYISRLPGGEEVIINALHEQPPLATQTLAHRFGVEDMLYTVKDTTFMVSLLYYFGVLTLAGETDFGELVLKIPNLVVRKLYVERIRDIFLPEFQEQKESQQAAKTLYQTGDMQPLCKFLERGYFKVFDNRDYSWADELTIKTAFLTVLFNDALYIMDSEVELERTYADLVMIVRPQMRRYPLKDILIEFKYVSLSTAKLTGKKAKQMDIEKLKALPTVQDKLVESRNQLDKYRLVLESKYGNLLRLQSYSVVAVGFDRLVVESEIFCCNPRN
ncbi:MAG: AAA family ATPase [Pseudomonadota bacterium]